MSHIYEDLDTRWRSVIRRRSFLAGLSVTGAALSAGKLIARDNDNLPKGDVAIIKFLAAAELVESDFWQQYNELGGVNGGNAAYKLALQNLDSDMPQYISDNTDDEMSHAAFLNVYLMSKGETPVNLDAFGSLPSSRATGAKQIGRLSNLMNLNVDTTWYTRYRSTQNLDLGGGPFPQAVEITTSRPFQWTMPTLRPTKSNPFLRGLVINAACTARGCVGFSSTVVGVTNCTVIGIISPCFGESVGSGAHRILRVPCSGWNRQG